jgi:hypothetical protein
MMAEMERLLKALFSFWEDITVVPQKFEKNYDFIFSICRRVLLLKDRLERFSVNFLNTKLIKTFVAFTEMVGFPEHEVKRAFYKIIMNNENALEKNFVSVRIRNTAINSRKTAVVIASAVRESMGEILYASSLVQEVLSHHASDLRGNNIKLMMPICYAQIHDKMMENYLEKQDAKKLKSRNFLTLVKGANGFVCRVGVFLKTYPFCDTQLKMVG